MTHSIQRWVPEPPRREFSDFATVAMILTMIRQSSQGPWTGSPAGREARKRIPAKRPHAQMFLAWQIHWKNPNAYQDTLKAMVG